MNIESMKIGIDFDEVLAEFVSPFLLFYEGVSGRHVCAEDIKSYNFWENGIGRTREEAVELVERFFQSDYFGRVPVVEGAYEAVARLSQEGLVYIITSRPSSFREKTEKFLQYHFPLIKVEIIYTGDFHKGKKTKAEVCKDLGVSELYEDNIHYARACAPYVKRVFLFDRPWNQAEVNGNIIRVKSWKEAMRRRDEYK